MKTKFYLSLCLLIFPTIASDFAEKKITLEQEIEKVLNNPDEKYVFVPEDVKKYFADFCGAENSTCPNEFETLFEHLKNGGSIVQYDLMHKAVLESLEYEKESSKVEILQKYNWELENGDAVISVIEEKDLSEVTRKRRKKIVCSLFVKGCLSVCGDVCIAGNLGVSGTFSGLGIVKSGENVGVGTGFVFQDTTSGSIMNFRTLLAGTGISITTQDNEVVINATGVSSRRFKDNIKDMDNDSEIFMQLRPVTFTYKSDENKTKEYGLIAEEVMQFMPELVCYDKDNLPYTVKYQALSPILLNEMQKMKKEQLELKERIQQLEKLIKS